METDCPTFADADGEAPSPYSQGCPTRAILDRIADKWTTLVIGTLGCRAAVRFTELRRQIDGISQKMLTQTLRDLERDGLVTRTSYPVIPPRVEYALTPLGHTLREPLHALEVWAREHMDEVRHAQQRFDTGRADAAAEREGAA
ncbi:MAG: helix-turn-helix transcriptional regulator [Candidatus Eremiobacteraeota bacterium]|nr:helix-turn-helix transcriptional regulator [Candidatus Eremiobacteraeota bacterium]